MTAVGLEFIDETRAAIYGLLASLLYQPPAQALLEAIASADDMATEAPHSAFAKSWRALQQASQVADTEALAEEFEQLFIGLGQGEVLPYMSWHLTGFLMEEPLARLRNDLAELGLAREAEVTEPEDHMAAVLEVMRFLVAGDADTPPASVSQQQKFFEAHLQPWYAKCVAQLEVAPSANYYRLVARMLNAFLDIEAQSFEIGD